MEERDSGKTGPKNEPKQGSEPDPYNIEVWYKLEKDKRFAVAAYNADNKRLTIFLGEGPYSWTLMFYRTYFNKLDWYQSKNSFTENRAEIEMDKIFGSLKQTGKFRLENILNMSDWEKKSRTNLASSQFDAILKELVAPVELYE
jgi:hypothetical protein